MNAVWSVRSRQLARKFRFWLAITGYDPNDHSLSQKLYLVYALIFFTAWGFSVLALLSSEAAVLLRGMGLAPAQAAVAITLLLILFWNLAAAFAASRRSPLIFTEEDATILCQSPVDRRSVTLAWLAGDWPEQNLLVWAIAVILGFAILDAAEASRTAADIPFYIFSGLRAISIVLPLALGLLELAWSLGIARLRRDRDIPALRIGVLALAGLLCLGLLFSGNGALLTRLSASPVRLALEPLAYPLRSAFGLQPWSPGLAVSLAWVLVGTACMLVLAKELNLSRAAQESAGRAYRLNLFPFFGSMPVEAMTGTRAVIFASKRPAGRAPSRLPPIADAGALAWKDIVQTLQAPSGAVFAWILAIVLALGFLLPDNWGVQVWSLLFWMILVYRQSTRRLESDLRQWYIFRQLPFASGSAILFDLSGSVIAFTISTWVAAAMTAIFHPAAFTSGLLALAPLTVAAIAAAAAFDVVRRSKTPELLAGNVPSPDLLGSILAGLFVAISAGGIILSPVLAVCLPVSLGIEVAGAYFFWKAAGVRLRNLS
ncbi:MAG: hypothetical protein ACM3PY_18170 [Omnitrophica WOR_2 bacterium]